MAGGADPTPAFPQPFGDSRLPPSFVIRAARATTAHEARLTLAQWLPAIIEVDRSTIMERAGTQLRQLVLNAGLVSEVRPALQFVDTITGVAMHRNESVRVPDTSTQRGDDCAMLAVAGLRSSLHVPVIVGEHSVGAVVLADHRSDFFTASHQEAIEAVAALLALHTTHGTPPTVPIAGSGTTPSARLTSPSPDDEDRPLVGLRRHRSLLRSALQHGDIGAQFQPIFRYPRRELVSIEALARWTDDNSIRTAGEFLSRSSGLTQRVTQRVAEQSATMIRDLMSHDVRAPQFAVNVAGADIDTMVHWWSEQALPDGSLALEVPFVDVFSSFEVAAKAMARGARQGVEFYLDDVYDDIPDGDISTLSLVGIKLSMALTRAVTTSAEARGSAERLVTFARRHGIYVVAKGVESVEQADTMRSIGVNRMQGYFFLPPVSRRELLNYIAPRSPIAG